MIFYNLLYNIIYMNKLPYELILKISSYYPSPELTAANFCDIKTGLKDRKEKLINKIIRQIIDDAIEDAINMQYL